MSGVVLVECVKTVLNYVIAREFSSMPNIEVTAGSDRGDGYASKTYAITAKGDEKTINFFVKYFPEDQIPPVMKEIYVRIFQNELRFYREVFPAVLQFQRDRNIERPFNNVPKHYAANDQDLAVPPVILENLRLKGYTLRDRKTPIDDKHITLTFKTFAKYHAVSYAMKDQEPKLFRKLSDGMTDILAESVKKFGMDKMVEGCVNQVYGKLDPITDKRILDRITGLAENLIEHAVTTHEFVDDYAVIGQGDCWSNNMMFLYDEETGDPIDVKLLDWQIMRVNTPVLDVAYYFYTVATKEILANFDYYFKFYYDNLTDNIRKMGSDPEELYPFSVYKQHWKKFSRFGLCMAFLIVKLLLFEKDEVPDLVETTTDELSADSFTRIIKGQEIYQQRITDLLEHFIDRDFL